MVMMATLVMGSGNTDGFTGALCAGVGSGLVDAGFGVQFFAPIDMEIEHCTGCNRCRETGRCIIDDDMCQIYDAFVESDLIVMATPIHFSGPSSVIKQVMDRFQWRWFAGDDGKKRSLVMLAAGGGQEPNFKNAISIMRSFAIAIGAEWLGTFTVSDTDSKEPAFCRDDAREYGRKLAQSIRD